MIIIIAIFVVGIIIIDVIHHNERKDLYDRLMSKNLSEYKSATDSTPPKAVKSKSARMREKWRHPNSKE